MSATVEAETVVAQEAPGSKAVHLAAASWGAQAAESLLAERRTPRGPWEQA